MSASGTPTPDRLDPNGRATKRKRSAFWTASNAPDSVWRNPARTLEGLRSTTISTEAAWCKVRLSTSFRLGGAKRVLGEPPLGTRGGCALEACRSSRTHSIGGRGRGGPPKRSHPVCRTRGHASRECADLARRRSNASHPSTPAPDSVKSSAMLRRLLRSRRSRSNQDYRRHSQ